MHVIEVHFTSATPATPSRPTTRKLKVYHDPKKEEEPDEDVFENV
jgi:hypothetical protein